MYKELTKCLCCDSTSLEEIINLNDQPLANSYRTSISEVLPKFPLRLNACNNCSHLQLSIAVDPDMMFKNYLYVSGTSSTLRAYFKYFAEMIRLEHPDAKTVLDIACNDGSQLDALKLQGFQTFGIDPATNLYDISTGGGHTVLCDYFNEKSAQQLNQKFDVITAQNVFAHNADPYEFLLAAKHILSDDGTIYIQTSQGDMVTNSEFDTIYHEHISFFNVYSMWALCRRADLSLNQVRRHSIHGNSYIFQVSKKCKTATEVVQHYQLYTNEDYREFAKNITDIRDKFVEITKELKKCFHLVGCGAAAKGNTFLNFCNVKLDSVIDENPLKYGLYLPGQNTWIRPFSACENCYKDNSTMYIPLAWNFYEEISGKINKITNTKNFYLIYFPEVRMDFK